MSAEADDSDDRIAMLEAEVRHWRGNHDEQVRRKRYVRDLLSRTLAQRASDAPERMKP